MHGPQSVSQKATARLAEFPREKSSAAYKWAAPGEVTSGFYLASAGAALSGLASAAGFSDFASAGLAPFLVGSGLGGALMTG